MRWSGLLEDLQQSILSIQREWKKFGMQSRIHIAINFNKLFNYLFFDWETSPVHTEVPLDARSYNEIGPHINSQKQPCP